jgi:hypothetical protein
MKGLDLLFTLFCFSTAASDQSHVVNLDPSNFDEIVIKSGKPSLVKFFAVRALSISITFSYD